VKDIDIPPHDNRTLEEAQKDFFLSVNRGGACPCCGLHAKIYKRKLYHTMVVALNHFYVHELASSEKGRYHSVTEVLQGAASRGGDFAKLKYWGLLEQQKERKKDNNPRSGYWRITDKGKAFIEGKISVPAAVYVFGARALGFSEETVQIRGSEIVMFDYNDTVNGVV